MKPTNVLDMHRTGDFGGQKVGMKIDENSLAHVMSLLTDLYSDPELAVIREYSTNARDSHIMAGKADVPIKVTLPNGMSPYFKVQDFGLGMSVSDIEETYSKYGASTKRGSNDANGMLGLGCKSALTYTSQFTISAVKDGMKSIVMVSRVEDGTGVMEIIASTPTDEGNSVEISVPVKPGNRFAQKAASFFRFWDVKTVLINEQPPVFIKGDFITPSLMVIPPNVGLEEDRIVMGGVSYPVPGGLYSPHRGYNSFKVVAFVEIGEVNFTPSRESLSMTPLTKATIATVKQDFNAALHAAVRADVEGAKDSADALARMVKWQGMLYSNMPAGVTYKGAKVETEYRGSWMVWTGYSGRYNYNEATTLDWKTVRDSTIILGFDRNHKKVENGLTPTQKKKLKALRDERFSGGGVTRFIFAEKDVPGTPWVANERILLWDDVMAFKLPKVERADNVPSYSVITPSGQAKVAPDDIDDTLPIYYISPRDQHHPGTIQSLTKLLGDATVVILGDNRVGKFQRDFPKASRLYPAVQALHDAAEKGLTAADRINLGMDYYDKLLLSALDDTLIDDPAIKDSIKVAKGLTTSTTMDTYAKVTKVTNNYGIRAANISGASVLGRYPLVQNQGRCNAQHATLYINAVYAATQNGAI